MEIAVDQRYLLTLPGYFTITEGIVKEISPSREHVLINYIEKDNKYNKWCKIAEVKFIEMLQNIQS